MKKNKYLILLASLIILLCLGAGSVFALEVNYNIPGLPSLGESPKLEEYVKYFFGLGIYLAGAVSLISFAIGAVGMIVSGGNPTKTSDAKDRMKGAILGLALVMFSFLILKTINESLVRPSLTPLPVIPAQPAIIAPGIYFYLGADCSKETSGPFISSQDAVSSPFNKMKSIKIINDGQSGTYYGIIFHKEQGTSSGGDCSLPITTEGCQQIPTDMTVAATTIFRWNNTDNPTSSGDGVSFYSSPYGNAAAAINKGEGVCLIDNKEIGKIFFKKASSLYFGSDDCPYAKNTTVRYKDKYKTFKDSPGFIDIKGNYLVVLFDGNAKSGSDVSYCQVFGKNVPNLKTQQFLATGHSIGNIYIIPTK